MEELVAHHDSQNGSRQRRKFRVRWRGYPPSHDSWEPRETLIEDVPEKVHAYERELEHQP